MKKALCFLFMPITPLLKTKGIIFLLPDRKDLSSGLKAQTIFLCMRKPTRMQSPINP